MVGKFERNKDTIQDFAESTATHVGRIAVIIASAVRDVTREIGDLITDGIEMREASKRAETDTRHFEVIEGDFEESARRRSTSTEH